MTFRRGAVVILVTALVSTLASTAWAAGLTLTSKTLGANTRAKPTFYPRSFVTANCNNLLTCTLGTPTRTPNNNDTLTVVFNTVMNQGTFCSAWSGGNTTNRSTTVTATISNNAGATGNDTLSITASSVSCSGGMKFGTIDLGHAGYVSSNIAYTNTSFDLTNAGSTPTIDLTLGGGSTGNTVASGAGSPANYACDAALQSSTGAACAPSKARTTATEQF